MYYIEIRKTALFLGFMLLNSSLRATATNKLSDVTLPVTESQINQKLNDLEKEKGRLNKLIDKLTKEIENNISTFNNENPNCISNLTLSRATYLGCNTEKYISALEPAKKNTLSNTQQVILFILSFISFSLGVSILLKVFINAVLKNPSG